MNFLKKLFAPVDLTSGNPLKKLLRFALPILLSSLLSNAFSLINSIVLKITVGGVSVTAINETGSISSILFNFAYGCTSGFAVIMANKKGSNDINKQVKTFYTSIFLSLIIALLITLIGFLSYKQLLTFLQIPSIYIDRAESYYQIILISFVLMVLSNLMNNFVTSLGNSSISLLVSLAGTIANIVFAFLFTGAIKLDVKGVALATLISNLLTFLLNLIYLLKKYPHFKEFKKNNLFDKKIAFDCLKMGIPLGLQWSILFIGSFYQQRKLNEFGLDIIVDSSGNSETISYAASASSCYSHIETYLTIPLSVMSTALLHYVGQNYGNRNKERIKQGLKIALIIDLISYFIVLIIGISIAKVVPYIFLPSNEINEQVIYYTSIYIYILCPFLICQGVLQLSRSTLQGIKKPIIPFISGVGELIIRILICAFIPSLINFNDPVSNESYIGLCFSTPGAWVISVIIMGGAVLYFVVIKKLDIVDKAIEQDKKDKDNNLE